MEIIVNARTDPDIKVAPLLSATKYHQCDPGVSIVESVAHFCRNLILILTKEGLQFKSRDANHPVLDRIGNALRLLKCRSSVHREIMDHEMNQFRGVMQSLERRHRLNKVLKRCSFPVNQGICGGDIHDRYEN